MSNDKPIAYTEGDTLVFRASGLGNSIRALVLALRGYEPCPPPPALQKAFDEGNCHEDEILAKAEVQLNRVVGRRQEEFNLYLDDDVLIRGHIDGRTEGPEPGVIVEAKALGPTLYGKFRDDRLFGSMPGYAYQVWAILNAYPKWGVLYMVGQKEGDHLNPLGTTQKYFYKPPVGDLEIKAKLSAVREHYKRGTLPEDCDCSGWCPYQHLHPAVEADDDLAGELDELADLYMDAKRQRDAADEMMAGCRDKMAKLLEQAGVDKAMSGRYATTRYVTKRPTYDHKAMKAAGWDLSPYTKIHETAIIKITPRSQDDS